MRAYVCMSLSVCVKARARQRVRFSHIRSSTYVTRRTRGWGVRARRVPWSRQSKSDKACQSLSADSRVHHTPPGALPATCSRRQQISANKQIAFTLLPLPSLPLTFPCSVFSSFPPFPHSPQVSPPLPGACAPFHFPPAVLA